MKSWTLRLPEPLFERLRERHAETYATHRLSFNRWVVALLAQALKPEGPRA